MANVLHKTTTPADYRQSVHTPDYPEADWYINPDISAVAAVPTRYWTVGTNPVTEMNQAAKDAVDAAIVAAVKASSKAEATASIDGNGGYHLRAIANLTIDEINSLRQWITSFKAATAAATSLTNLQTRVAALPNTPNRTLTQAKTAYKNLLANGTLDE